MKKKKILITSFILILIVTIVVLLFNTSNGSTIFENGITWSYEEKNGEAVKVMAKGGLYATYEGLAYNKDTNTFQLENGNPVPVYNYYYFDDNIIRAIEVPSHLNGLPVTEIIGNLEQGGGKFYRKNFLGKREGDYWVPYAPDDATDINDTQTKVEKVILPNTLKTIGEYSFWQFPNLKEIEFPSSLERIEPYAFCGTNIENVELNGLIYLGNHSFENANTKSVRITNTQVIEGFGDSDKLTTITIGQGVQDIQGFGNCPNATNVQIGSDLRRMNINSFTGMKDIYIATEEENVELYGSMNSDKIAYIHFNNHEKIDTDLPEGVKLIDDATGEEFTSKKFATGSDVTLRLEKEDGYEFDDYVVYLESFGDYYNSPKVVEKIDLKFGETYTINDLQRAGTVHFQNRKDGLDLSLRQYIKSINGEELAKTREPVTEITYGKPVYKHTKENIYPKKGDIITYAIRVNNEGTVNGKATEIKDYIPQGLKFAEDSEINTQYGWVKSDDGRTATTTYLNSKEIEKYTIYGIDYEEVYIDLIVDIEDSQEMTRLVNMATIMGDSGDDVDSIPGEVDNPNDAEYKKEESEISTSNSYIAGDEDDYDFENIYSSYSVPLPYSLVIKKIDGIDSRYLNEATFDLLDSDKNVVKTGVTANGGVLDFGSIYTFGIGTTTFYVRETYTPEGYRNHLKYLIQVDLINEYDIATGLNTRVELDIKDIDIDTSIFEEIEISTKEQLMGIQNDSDKKYVLTQDIDLGGVNWTPLNVSNVKFDGKGHKITGLKIDTTAETANKVGLFGTYSGIIENLTLENVDIDVTKTNTEVPEEETEADIDAVGAFIGYANNTIIKNCKVTGTIDTEVRNVGGFVGHTKEGKILVSRDNTNEATITANGHNVGGILGCGLGPVKVYNTVNNGTINAESYNAGGIIGCIIPSRYELTQVFGNYDLDNKVATLAIKNDAIKSKYQLKVEKTDVSGNLIDGAKFQILNNNKQVIEGLDSVEVEDGVLYLDKTIIDSIGSDVYYLKEIEAPEGYEKLTNQYIKLIITKKWNKEKSEYYIETSLDELTEEELREDEILSRNTSEVKTDLIYNKQEENVLWNVPELDMENSKNTAEIINEYEKTIAGGLVGTSQGRTLIDNCSNEGKVESKGDYAKTAGIIGQITKKDEGNKAFITNCKNTANVNGHATNESLTEWGSKINKEGSTGGIVAYSNIDLQIDKCTNESKVHGYFTAVAGILTKGLDNIVITNCTNKGQVEGDIILEEIPLITGYGGAYQYRQFDTSGAEVAGIIADNILMSREDEDKPLTISGCTNEGNLSGYNHVAGILAHTNTNLLNVENCENKNCSVIGKTAIKPGDEIVDGYSRYENDIGKGFTSGIVGLTLTEDINISNSIVTNSQIENNRKTSNTDNKSAGILAGNYGSGAYKSGISCQNVNIANCDVVSSDVISEAGDTAGIISYFGYGPSITDYNVEIMIKDCDISDSNIASNGGTQTAVSGIAGSGYCIKNIKIENCNLNESNITYGTEETEAPTYGSCYVNVAGLLADDYAGSGPSEYNIAINDCNIDKVDINNFGKESRNENGYGINTSFGMAGIYMSQGKFIANKIEVTNSKMYSRSGNTSGIYNIVAGGGSYSDVNVSEVNNCLVENTKMELISENYNGNDSIGGIVGETNLTTRINNSVVRNCEINADNIRNAGGIAGNVLNNATAKIINCDVIDTDIKLSNSHGQIGGIAGEIGSGINIENCNVKGVNKRAKIEGAATQMGGITGTSHNSENPVGEHAVVIDECTVENIDMTFTGNASTSSGAAFGGIIAGSNYEPAITNCSVKNCIMNSNALSNGGVLGYTWYKGASIKGCTVQDSTMNIAGPASNAGGIVGISLVSEELIKESSINNITINVTSGNVNVGGLYGVLNTYGLSTPGLIQNLDISNITINNATSGCTGGLVGISASKLTVKNIDTNLISVTSGGHTGGLIGLTPNAVIDNVNTSNTTLKLNSGYTFGGFIGLVTNEINNGRSIDLSNLEIKDSTVNKLKMETTYGVNAGGLVGECMNPIVSNVTMTDIDIKASGKTGGMIGIVTKSSSLMSNSSAVAMSEFNDVTINKSTTGANIISGNNEHTGILLGMGKVKVTTANISDVTINGNSSNTVGTIGFAESAESNLTGITLNRITMSSNRGYAGLVVGVSAGNVSSCNVSNSTLTANGSETGGIIAIQVKQNASGDIIKNCNVMNTTISGAVHVGGIAGFSGNNISGCTVTDSSVIGTSNGVGGILGHGSNFTGTDVAITNSKVVTTNITGTEQVGGISGGAIVTIENCYVGGKEGVTYTQDEPAVTVTGTEGVGGIIGDAGVISYDNQYMVTIKDNTLQDTKIERIVREKAAGESDDEHKMIGIHNSFGTKKVSGQVVQYEGTQVETITGNTVTNVVLNEIEE